MFVLFLVPAYGISPDLRTAAAEKFLLTTDGQHDARTAERGAEPADGDIDGVLASAAVAEQHQASDFYYRDKLTALHGTGFLSRLDAAFSRDQRTRVYVQDRMREQGAHLWSWLQDGAHLYVCGDASRMARDVDLALRELIARHGGMSGSAAAAYLRQLTAGLRYARDVY